MSRQILMLIGAGLLLAAAVNFLHPAGVPWTEDWGHRAEAQAVREGVAVVYLSDMLGFMRDQSRLFVDARPADQYATARLPGAVSLPLESLDLQPEAVAAVLASDRPPVFYCDGPECDDALLTALHLRNLGRSDVAVFIGGIELWQAELLMTEGEAVQ